MSPNDGSSASATARRRMTQQKQLLDKMISGNSKLSGTAVGLASANNGENVDMLQQTLQTLFSPEDVYPGETIPEGAQVGTPALNSALRWLGGEPNPDGNDTTTEG